MGDRIERFIQDNREGFDAAEPGDGIWGRIDGELNSRERKSWSLYWKVAAMIFLVSTVVLLIDKYAPIGDQDASELSEFVEAERFYTSLIAERKTLIESYQNQGSLHRDFLDDMNELDDLYLELRTSFERTHGDQKLIDAMISNLFLRMRILDRQIEILERINELEDESEKPASI